MLPQDEELPINLQRLQAVTRGKVAVQKRLLEIFFPAAQGDIAALKEAIANQDFPTIEHKAHQLKGSSANVGIAKMSIVAAELQKQANQRNLSEANQLLNEIENYLQKARQFAETYFSN
ncbi:Hpt domain-containing protein [Aerosakkonemataceae cyanobacterium BLCC-F50]|uniref:Hpt domain-containing protein n=1 Tax=Floridaenema flaviceps BLCC-F50 TaxID=3153642 RepID=A0ABV4XW79_9CYAN